MKTGRSLNEIAAEITRQNETKKDYITSTANLAVVADEKAGVALEVKGKGAFPIRPVAHGQIAEHTKIPKTYYDRMLTEAPGLLANNVNEWFARYPAARLVRTLDGNNRALLSDKFATLDNFDFANAILPIVAERKLEIKSCEVTETKLYIKVIDTQEFKVPVGYKMGDGSHKIFDICCPALIFSNSEVGFGRLSVDIGTYTSACTNLAWFSKDGFKRTHVGARHLLTENLSVGDLDQIMSDETKRKTQEALWLQVRDVTKSAFDPKIIADRSARLEAAGNEVFKASEAAGVVEVVGTKLGLNGAEKNSVLELLLNGGNLSQYGVHAAITRTAQDVEDYDRATDLEYLGGKVIDLRPAEWRQLAEAA